MLKVTTRTIDMICYIGLSIGALLIIGSLYLLVANDPPNVKVYSTHMHHLGG